MPHNVHIAVAVVITRGEAQVFEYSTVLIIILHNPLMRGTSLARTETNRAVTEDFIKSFIG